MGLCRPPWLKTVVEWRDVDLRGGAWGYWRESNLLYVNADAIGYQRPAIECETRALRSLPFRIEQFDALLGDLRLVRDGWRRIGEEVRPGPNTPLSDDVWHSAWQSQPTPRHPTLHWTWHCTIGASRDRFSLSSHSDVLGDAVQHACWDALGQLVVDRAGVLDALRPRAWRAVILHGP